MQLNGSVDCQNRLHRAFADGKVLGSSRQTASSNLMTTPPAAAFAQQLTEQRSQQLCSSSIRQVACYYDATWTAIAGISLQSSTEGTQALCRTQSSPGTVIAISDGVGIESVTVTSAAASRRVIKLEFRWVARLSVCCCALSCLIKCCGVCAAASVVISQNGTRHVAAR